AYDDHKLFSACSQAEIYLVTQVNKRNASSPATFRSEYRQQNWRFVTQGLGKKFLSKGVEWNSCFLLLKPFMGWNSPGYMVSTDTTGILCG
ncbi:hypothetical protein, partial [Paenactinomyces guangxiensis]